MNRTKIFANKFPIFIDRRMDMCSKYNHKDIIEYTDKTMKTHDIKYEICTKNKILIKKCNEMGINISSEESEAYIYIIKENSHIMYEFEIANIMRNTWCGGIIIANGEFNYGEKICGIRIISGNFKKADIESEEILVKYKPSKYDLNIIKNFDDFYENISCSNDGKIPFIAVLESNLCICIKDNECGFYPTLKLCHTKSITNLYIGNEIKKKKLFQDCEDSFPEEKKILSMVKKINIKCNNTNESISVLKNNILYKINNNFESDLESDLELIENYRDENFRDNYIDLSWKDNSACIINYSLLYGFIYLKNDIVHI